MSTLALAPHSAAPYLGRRLRAVPPADAQKIAKWIKDLDDNGFATRRAASIELEQLGELAEPALRNALQGATSPEVRRQSERLLVKMIRPSGERLRQIRAIETLEYLNIVEARQVLQTLAKGAPEATQTREAKAALERLPPR
jgi:hypothetical protein